MNCEETDANHLSDHNMLVQAHLLEPQSYIS
jgi:hypothetical protein